MEKKDLKNIIIKIVILIVFMFLIIFVSVKYAPQVIKLISNVDTFKNFILSYGFFGILVYIFFQIMQIVIAIIPGEVLQIAGGYIYGTVFGTIYTLIGIFIGVIIAFMLTKLLGYSIIKLFVPKDKLEKFNFLINSPKSEILMFILFLIPGLPKDVLTYIAGLTPIRPVRFFVLSSIARFPGILGSAYIGSKLGSKNYISVIIVSAIAIILFISGVVFQEKIVNFLHNLKSKNSNTK